MEYLIGIIIGLLLGISGGGGAIFAVPLLMIFLKIQPADAASLALVAVTVSALFGVMTDFKNVRFLPGLFLGFGGVIAAPFGVMVAIAMDPSLLLIGFSLLACLIAAFMWNKSNCPDVPDWRAHERDSNSYIAPQGGTPTKFKNSVTKMVGAGLTIGFISGLFGIGGGIFVVPFLQRCYRFTMHSALATSLFVIGIIGSSGFISSLILGGHLDKSFFATFSFTAVIGMVIGQRMNSLISPGGLQKIFSIFLILITGINILNEFQVFTE